MTEDWIEQFPDTLRLAARPLDIRKGQYIFRFGDEADAVYRVVEGEVCLTRFSPEGTEIVLHRAREGDFFAEASLFGTHYHCDAICTRPGRCLRLPAETLRHCLANDPGFAMEWIATLSRNLRRQRASQERLGLKSLRLRVIHYLVDRGKEGRVELDQPIIRWATELGASHEALYRTLAEMEREGILQRQGQTLTLMQRQPGSSI
ncbi:Crp/Fnr family transcriptional regulator [Devosia sp.]|uniref:Crp/Fnr family transcriptional regulator n=1 Tax=Devosia sp. TaxID=1871048 RepID=UPI0027322C20|nr:Crp/Fnr family transcriptional regulator [Devosia sp.]MDP2782599.1 Crp/Fnr family transcriptional regulator [Devosia sp.]